MSADLEILTEQAIKKLTGAELHALEQHIKRLLMADLPALMRLALAGGMLDPNLEEVKSLTRRREEFLASEKMLTLQRGSYITISNQVSPKLLAGASCEVVGFEGDKVKVKLLETRSEKWRLGQTVTLPKTLIG